MAFPQMLLSGGQGGMSIAPEANSATGDTSGSAGGQVFTFEAPASVKAASYATPLVIGAVGLGALFLLKKMK